MALHVLFLKDGTPAWVGPEPRADSEPVEGRTLEFLAAHRRTARGTWVARPVPVPVEPTPGELAERAEAEYKARLPERDAALQAALAETADPLFFQWQRGEVAKEDWLAAVAEIRAQHPKPDRG